MIYIMRKLQYFIYIKDQNKKKVKFLRKYKFLITTNVNQNF